MKPLPDIITNKPLNHSTVSEFEMDTSRQSADIQEGGFWWTCKKIMNPPIYATLIAIPLAAIPYMKEYVFVGSGSILAQNVFKALVVLGGSVSPMINILLGCNLSRGYPPGADIKW
jgi:predicted permease